MGGRKREIAARPFPLRRDTQLFVFLSVSATRARFAFRTLSVGQNGRSLSLSLSLPLCPPDVRTRYVHPRHVDGRSSQRGRLCAGASHSWHRREISRGVSDSWGHQTRPPGERPRRMRSCGALFRRFNTTRHDSQIYRSKNTFSQDGRRFLASAVDLPTQTELPTIFRSQPPFLF